ncbi:MAG: class I adenylate-forming enzyme family protein [Pseudomonadota bacterium]
MDPRRSSLGYWCFEAAARYPDKIALIDLSGAAPRSLTYAELERRLDQAAGWMRAAGLAPGDRLAMAVGNRLEFIEIFFGAMRAGVVPVPLNTRLGPETLAYIIENADCRAAVAEPAVNADLAPAAEALGLPVRAMLDGGREGWADYAAARDAAPLVFEPPTLPERHPAFQPYTSGSTGRPKGVVLTHEGQMWWLRCVQKYWPSAPEARALAAVPLYHKNAMAGAIKPMLHAGGSVVLLPDFEPRRFLETLSERRCTKAGAVPTVYTKLLQHRDLIETLDFSALQLLTVGSATVQKELVEQIHAAFGCPVAETYGLTEGGPVMIGPPLDGRAVPLGSCGVAWPEGEVKLVDARGAEHGAEGELWVRNPGVTPGYHKLPEVNAARLQDGWLATGDLFRRDEQGFFYFLGRTDDMFKTAGESVYPKEVENLLIAHPKVFDACVSPIADPEKGMVPAALVMLEAGEHVEEAELKRWALARGPAYAHPRRIAFTDAMPLNGAGKVDRLSIREKLSNLFAAEIAAKRGARDDGATR